MRRGFTLVEMMVAVTITATLVLGVSAATLGVTRSAEIRRAEARRQEQRAQAVELLTADWRGRERLILPATLPPAGTSIIAFSTTSDGLGATARSGADVRWIASERGLARREKGRTMQLLDGPVVLEAWTGKAWTSDIRGAAQELRLTFTSPNEQVLVK